MASISVARTRRSPQPGKTEVYQKQNYINLALQNVVLGCQQIEPLNIIPRSLLLLYANMAEELRALINATITDEMRSVEVEDAKHFQDQRIKWESRPRPQPGKRLQASGKKIRK